MHVKARQSVQTVQGGESATIQSLTRWASASRPGWLAMTAFKSAAIFQPAGAAAWIKQTGGQQLGLNAGVQRSEVQHCSAGGSMPFT